MRPKKRIALWGADADRMGVLSFVLRTNSWNVLDRALAKYPPRNLDAALVICDGSQSDAGKWVRAAQTAARGRVVAILGTKTVPPKYADISLSAIVSNQELLERLAVISARKRGPQKGAQRTIRPEISAVSTGFLHSKAAAVQK